MLAPVVVGATGGGVLASVGRTLYERDFNVGEYNKLKVERSKLESRLNKLKTELAIKRPVIDKLKEQSENKN